MNSPVEAVAKALHEELSRQDVMAYLSVNFDLSKLAIAALAAAPSPPVGVAEPVAWRAFINPEKTEWRLFASMEAALSMNSFGVDPLYATPPEPVAEIDRLRAALTQIDGIAKAATASPNVHRVSIGIAIKRITSAALQSPEATE